MLAVSIDRRRYLGNDDLVVWLPLELAAQHAAVDHHRS